MFDTSLSVVEQVPAEANHRVQRALSSYYWGFQSAQLALAVV
jgi:hypothetical protein